MAEATTNTTTIIARADQHDIDLHKASDRVNFGSIREPIDVPYLLGVQTDSFDWLIGNERWQKRVQEDLENGTNTVPHTSGLDEVFQEISPIENFAQTMSLTFSDPEEHDRIIAFTSQLAHIVSSAYVKSPEAQKRRGFSAGSFQDMTRVARLDEDMWTELFFDNREALLPVVEDLVQRVTEYRDALRDENREEMRKLLREGRETKERLTE